MVICNYIMTSKQVSKLHSQRCHINNCCISRNGKPIFGKRPRFTSPRHNIKNTSVVETVRRVEMIGKEQYEIYVEGRLQKCKKAHTEVITKNKLALFRTKSKQSSKPKMHVTALKSDFSFFSRLFISCLTRDGDFDRFFAHACVRCSLKSVWTVDTDVVVIAIAMFKN